MMIACWRMAILIEFSLACPESTGIYIKICHHAVRFDVIW